MLFVVAMVKWLHCCIHHCAKLFSHSFTFFKSNPQVKLDSASKVLVSNWLKIARGNLQARFKEQGEWIWEDVQMIITKVTPEDDVLLGEELRCEGMTLVTQYQNLEDDRRYVWMNGT